MSKVNTNEKVLAAEASTAGIRVAVIGLNSVAYAFLLDQAGTLPWLAWTIIVSANLYGLFVLLAKPYRRFPVMLSSYFTTLLDAAFITVWIFATGGWESPFHLLWMLSVTAVAFRFDMRAAITAAVVYTVCYAGLLYALGEFIPNLGEAVVRMGYVFLVATLGGLLSREVDVQTKEKAEAQALAEALRESEERFRRLSDASFEGIGIHENGRVLEANARFCQMMGYTLDEVKERSAKDFIDPVSWPVLSDHLAHPSDAPYELLARRKDGTTFLAEVTARDIPWNGRPCRVVTLRDVSERQKAIRAVRERETLAAQNERLKEMDTIKSRFINNAAHELGTPLTPIKLQAHLLKLGQLGDLNDKQRRAVDVLARNVDHLGLMVKDLLDASRIQSHELRLDKRTIDLHTVLTESVGAFMEGRGTGVTIRYEGEPGMVVEADPARITQVVFNLISNALKFTPQGGRIEVGLRLSGDEAIVEVADTGEGIAPTDLARLFQPFSQVHDTMQQTKSGKGLGLYIAKGIIESHGGRIWATSEGHRKGATFAFSLPLAAPAVRIRA